MNNKNCKVILTGYRATGKSSIGKKLAERLNLKFVDMDKIIENRFGSVHSIVEEHGWEYFRAKEKELLRELAVEPDIVIAAGGGAVMHEEEWKQLKKTGFTVWLTADVDTICQRLASDQLSDTQRPSLTGKDIREEVTEVLTKRLQLYKEGSHISIDTTGTIDEIVDTIELELTKDCTSKG